jgi:sec-independent protein translocase protein TatB
MFGVDSTELLVIGLVALLVIGPQRLPLAMRTVGQWVAKGRAMTRHLRTGFDAMVREAELEEMQKAWAAQNEAIMKATAMDPTAFLDPGNPTPKEPDPAEAALADLTVPLPPESGAEPAEEPAAGAETPPAKPRRPRKPRARKALALPTNDQP